jgi:hypothetical protein
MRDLNRQIAELANQQIGVHSGGVLSQLVLRLNTLREGLDFNFSANVNGIELQIEPYPCYGNAGMCINEGDNKDSLVQCKDISQEVLALTGQSEQALMQLSSNLGLRWKKSVEVKEIIVTIAREQLVQRFRPNCTFLQIRNFGWPLIVVVATEDISEGRELLVDSYGKQYWNQYELGLATGWRQNISDRSICMDSITNDPKDRQTLDPTIAALKLTNSRAYSPNYRQTCNENTNLEVQEWNQRNGMGLDVRNLCLQPASKDGVVFYPLKVVINLDTLSLHWFEHRSSSSGSGNISCSSSSSSRSSTNSGKEGNVHDNWACPKCTFLNPLLYLVCGVCTYSEGNDEKLE